MFQLGNITPVLLVKWAGMVMFSAWIIHSVVDLTAIVMASDVTHEASADSLKTAANDNKKDTKETIDISGLKAIALFGKVAVIEEEAEPVVPQEEPAEEVVETKLNLTLKGLFTSDDSEAGQAIIANGRNDQLYRAGADIEGLSNVSLLEVFSDRVILNNRGTKEILYLYPESERLGVLNSTTSAEVSGFLSNDAEPNAAFGAAAPVPPKTLNEMMRVVRERDKISGEMLGFRVLPGRDRESFERSGLQVNDVITSIDGERLTDLRTAMSIYHNKRESSAVSLVVLRDGNEVSIDIDLAVLN